MESNVDSGAIRFGMIENPNLMSNQKIRFGFDTIRHAKLRFLAENFSCQKCQNYIELGVIICADSNGARIRRIGRRPTEIELFLAQLDIMSN